MTTKSSKPATKKSAKSKTQKKQASEALKLQGDCTIYETAAIKAELLDYLNKTQQAEIDLSGVKSIDASFLQLLMATDAEVRAQEKTIAFSNLSEAITEMATLLHAEPLLSAAAGQRKE